MNQKEFSEKDKNKLFREEVQNLIINKARSMEIGDRLGIILLQESEYANLEVLNRIKKQI